MHIKAQRPVFVPAEMVAEFDQMSKAALMDLVWDFASRCVDSAEDHEQVVAEFRNSRDVILHYRQESKRIRT